MKKKNSKYFIASLVVKSIYLIPQTATFTTFGSPFLAALYLISLVLNLKAMKMKKFYAAIFLLKPNFLRKKVVSSA